MKIKGHNLITHKESVLELPLFEVTGVLGNSRAQSIRHRIEAGRTWAESAIAEGWISSPTSVPLIVGQGPCAWSVAMTCLESKIPIVMVLEGPRFPQLRDANKYVLPHFYEWPRKSHKKTRAEVPHLGYCDAYISKIVAEWEREIDRNLPSGNHWIDRPIYYLERSRNEILELVHNYTPNFVKSFREKVFDDCEGSIDPSLMLLTSTYIEEKRHLRCPKGNIIYTGAKYWHQGGADPWMDRSFRGKNILITGGGDGGLQEFVRTITKKDNPRDVPDALSSLLKYELGPAIFHLKYRLNNLESQLNQKIDVLDDQINELFNLGDPDRKIELIKKTKEEVFQEFSLEVINNVDALWKRAKERVDLNVFRDFFKSHFKRVILHTRRNHFGSAFTFNQVFGYLLIKVVQDSINYDPWLVESAEMECSYASEKVPENPKLEKHCREVPLVIDFGSRKENFDYAIIRHGYVNFYDSVVAINDQK